MAPKTKWWSTTLRLQRNEVCPVTLELRNIVKQVDGETHIYDTTLTLADEGFNILLGTTLAGKTTLMHLMAGLMRPTSGEVWFRGQDVTGVPVQARNISMVYQQFINYPNMSVFENIASPLRIAGMNKADLTARVEQMAELLQIAPMLGRRPSQLSGGQQQRTALARALVKDAELVLLDEPLANLDFKLREELRDELPKLLAGRECTVVYATSDPAEALLLGGHTATLHEGRVTQFGPSSKVYRHPVDLTTAQVFSEPSINIAQVTKTGDEIRLGRDVHWTLPARHKGLADGRYQIGIRPHHVAPVADKTHNVKIEGDVQISELSGSDSVIYFSHGDLNWVSQSRGLHIFDLGQRVPFYIDAAQCLYFSSEGAMLAS